MDQTDFSFALQQLLQTQYGRPLRGRALSAFGVAWTWHEAQFRETREGDGSPPYITHPVGTATLAMKYFPSVPTLPDDLETVICTALLHDVIEDNPQAEPGVIEAAIETACGPTVLRYVRALTNPGGDKQCYSQGILAAGPTAVFVKICDSMHNLSCAPIAPPDLVAKIVDKAWKLYLPMLERCSLGEAFEASYRDAITHAESTRA